MHDLRYTARMLAKSPTFTLVAVAILALGVGANTAIFTFVSAFLLRPLPIEHPDETVMLSRGGGAVVSYPDYLAWRDKNPVFSGLAAFLPYGVDVKSETGRQHVFAELTSENYFQVLGAGTAAGRTFSAKEDDRVVVVSREFWKRWLDANPDLSHQTVNINNHVFTVIGVMPESFTGLASPWRTDVWVPFSAQHQIIPGTGALIIGRLKPAVTVQQARAAMTVLDERLHAGSGAAPEKLAIQKVGGLRYESMIPIAALLMVIVGLILLIACANLANLLTVRAAGRRHEIAVRLAVGASRVRLIRQLLTESAVLSVLGGTGGLLLAYWTGDLLSSLIPDSISGGFVIDHRPDWRVLSFTLGLCALSIILFALRPALAASKAELAPALKNEGVSIVRGSRMRGFFVIAQVASAMVVLIVASLFIRSLVRLETLNLGFDTRNLLIVELNPPEGAGDQRAEYYRQAEERVRSLPGVRSVSLLSGMPLGIEGDAVEMYVPGRAPIATGRNDVDAAYLPTMGISLVRGRHFQHGDSGGVIINETLARRGFAGADPVGRRIQLERGGPAYEVIGVAKDVRYSPLRDAPVPYVYVLRGPVQTQSAFLLARTVQEPGGMVSSLRREIRAHVETANDYLGPVLAPARSSASLMSILGGLALLLAAVGLYGVMAYSTAQRTREIGIRMALGAPHNAVVRLVLGEGLLLTSTGVAFGTILGLASAQLLSSFLYGLSATDPGALAGAALVLIASAATATYAPLRRAVRVDPAVVLRHE